MISRFPMAPKHTTFWTTGDIDQHNESVSVVQKWIKQARDREFGVTHFKAVRFLTFIGYIWHHESHRP